MRYIKQQGNKINRLILAGNNDLVLVDTAKLLNQKMIELIEWIEKPTKLRDGGIHDPPIEDLYRRMSNVLRQIDKYACDSHVNLTTIIKINNSKSCLHETCTDISKTIQEFNAVINEPKYYNMCDYDQNNQSKFKIIKGTMIGCLLFGFVIYKIQK